MRGKFLWACVTPYWYGLSSAHYKPPCTGRVCLSPRMRAMRPTMTIPVLREAVSADNNYGGARDGLRAQQTPHSPVFDSSLVPENCTSRGSCADTHGLSLPALLPGGGVSQPLVPGSAHRPRGC